MTVIEKLPDLAGFTGTEYWYRHGLIRDVLFTDGAKYVADQAGAYWLLDEIALAQRYRPEVKAEEFQVWKLALDAEGAGAALSCEDGNGREVFRHRIAFTDFPAPGIELWFTGSVILLPSEY